MRPRYGHEEDFDAADALERRELGIEDENGIDNRLNDAVESEEDDEWDDLLDEEDRP
jgi:hypothetical protein